MQTPGQKNIISQWKNYYIGFIADCKYVHTHKESMIYLYPLWIIQMKAQRQYKTKKIKIESENL